jgi:hypothetical protein
VPLPQATAGLTNHPGGAGGEFPPEALVAGMGLLEVMRDVFLPSDAEWLTDRWVGWLKCREHRRGCSIVAGGFVGCPHPRQCDS